MIGLYWGVVSDKNIHQFEYDTYIRQMEKVEQTDEKLFTKNWNFISTIFFRFPFNLFLRLANILALEQY